MPDGIVWCESYQSQLVKSEQLNWRYMYTLRCSRSNWHSNKEEINAEDNKGIENKPGRICLRIEKDFGV